MQDLAGKDVEFVDKMESVPLRELIYVTNILEQRVKKQNIYGKKLLRRSVPIRNGKGRRRRSGRQRNRQRKKYSGFVQNWSVIKDSFRNIRQKQNRNQGRV